MRGTIEERFWAKVRKTDGCWHWQGAIRRDGYGAFAVTSKWIVGAHRVAWQLTYGEPHPEMSVLHRCDVRDCVNPSHLFLGTLIDNLRDMAAKRRGRWPVMSFLSDDAVRDVRACCAAGELHQRVALRFGVSRSTVSRIVNGHRRRSAQ